MNEKLQNSSKEIEEKNVIESQLKEIVHELQIENELKEKQIKKLKGKKENGEVQSPVKNSDNEIAQMKEDLKVYDQIMKDQKEENVKLKGQIEDIEYLKSLIDQMQKEKEDQKSIINEQIRGYEEKITMLENQNKTVQNESESKQFKNEIEFLSQTIQILKTEKEELEKRSQSQQNIISELQNKLESLKLQDIQQL